jgi:hypothetical protein
VINLIALFDDEQWCANLLLMFIMAMQAMVAMQARSNASIINKNLHVNNSSD